jgi:prepilin-type N-terminal cleavage/methylation domain-containing protein
MASRQAQRGFTLLELLLVLVLLLLFASVAVVSLTPLRQGADLNEGVGQLESMLRFARAEAAQEGRRFQVQFRSAPSAGTTGLPASSVQVSWEPRPLAQPGVFVADASTGPLAESVSNLLYIENVRHIGAGQNPAPANTNAAPAEAQEDAASAAPLDPVDSTNAETWPPINFYPDGSSDSAEIIVASNDSSDPRRMLVHWDGLSGSATHQETCPQSSTESGENAPSAAQPLEPASVARSAMGQGAP